MLSSGGCAKAGADEVFSIIFFLKLTASKILWLGKNLSFN